MCIIKLGEKHEFDYKHCYKRSRASTICWKSIRRCLKDIEGLRQQIEKRGHVEALKIKKLYNQLVLTSEKALSYLNFVGTLPEGEL